MKLFPSVVAVMALAVAGCAGYRWTSDVPDGLRTVAVPTFRNETDVTELGSVMTTQLLREFQREGTFSLRSVGDAALEVQGIVASVSSGLVGYDRRSGMRSRGYRLEAEVKISVIDKRNGRVLVDNRTYRPVTTFASGSDVLTSVRDASGRLAEDLARQVVDDIVGMKWAGGKSVGEDAK